MELELLAVDTAAIENGEWMETLPDCGDLRILTRGMNCNAFQRMQAKLLGAVPRKDRRDGRFDPITMRAINLKCIVETCLAGWANLTSGNAPVPYSIETARSIIADPRFTRLHDAFVVAADRVGELKNDEIEDAAKNLASVSTGP